MVKKHKRRLRLPRILVPFWRRIHGHLMLVGTHPAPINPKARYPNKNTGAPTKHVKPTKKPGEGLVGTRAAMHRIMLALLGNPFAWTYNEVRPLRLPKRRLTPEELASQAATRRALGELVGHYRSDCSWGTKTVDFLAGCKDDPTGELWGPWGNSTSEYEHLEKRPGLDNAYAPKAADLANCQVGDDLLFGPDGVWHATKILEAGPDPLLWSDGFGPETGGSPHVGAPNSYRLSDDTRRPISVCIPKGLA